MNKLRQILDQRGMSISDLMRASGLSWPTCSRVYNAKSFPYAELKWETVTTIAQALAIDPRDLISNNGTE